MSTESMLAPHNFNNSFLYREAEKLHRFNNSNPLCSYTSNPPCLPLQCDFVQKGALLGLNTAIYILSPISHLTGYSPFTRVLLVISDVSLRILMPTAGLKEMLQNLSIMFEQKTITYEKCTLPPKVVLSVLLAYFIGSPTIAVETRNTILPIILNGFGFTNPVMDFVETIETTAQKKASIRMRQVLKRKAEMIQDLENFQLLLNTLKGRMNIGELTDLGTADLIKKFVVLGQAKQKPQETRLSKWIYRFSKFVGIGFSFFPVATGCIMTQKVSSSISFLRAISPLPATIQGILNTCIQWTLVPGGIAEFVRYLLRMQPPHAKGEIARKLFPKMSLVTSGLAYLISGLTWCYVLNRDEKSEELFREFFGSIVANMAKYINPIMTSMLTVPFFQNLAAEITLTLGRYVGSEEEKQIALTYYMVQEIKKMLLKATTIETERFIQLIDGTDETRSTPSVREVASRIDSRSENNSVFRPSSLGKDILHVEEPEESDNEEFQLFSESEPSTVEQNTQTD